MHSLLALPRHLASIPHCLSPCCHCLLPFPTAVLPAASRTTSCLPCPALPFAPAVRPGVCPGVHVHRHADDGVGLAGGGGKGGWGLWRGHWRLRKGSRQRAAATGVLLWPCAASTTRGLTRLLPEHDSPSLCRLACPSPPLPRCRLLPSLPPSLLPAVPHQRGVDQRVGQGCEPVGDGGAVLLDPGGTPALP